MHRLSFCSPSAKNVFIFVKKKKEEENREERRRLEGRKRREKNMRQTNIIWLLREALTNS